MSTDFTPCIHFGECGGCRFQDVPYADQLLQKQAVLQELFAEFCEKLIEVVPSPLIRHYRNKLEFNFGRRQYPEPPPKDFIRESVLGFKRTGRWYWTIDLEDCLLAPLEAPKLLTAVRDWMKVSGLRSFHSRSNDGVLRHLVWRTGQHTGEHLVLLLTREVELDAQPFVDAVHTALPQANVLHGIYRGKADVAYADEIHLLHGTPYIHENLHIPTDNGEERQLRFRISPMSFFQTNPLATENLYARIRAWVRQQPVRKIFDLYGGSGGIAFACADLAEEIVSVENVSEASADGRVNAELNNCHTVRFVTADVRRYLADSTELEDAAADSLVIIDPPRSALHPKVLTRLSECGASRIIYVSCNPKLLARELPLLLTRYTLDELCAFDLFPHTPHVEALALLSLR